MLSMWRFAVLCSFLTTALLGLPKAHALEGVSVNDQHARIKQELQGGLGSLERLQKVVLPGLRQLIAQEEKRYGKFSPQVAVLLIDIGEAALREATQLQGPERRERA